MNLKDKVAIVTGAAQGIGLEIAKTLANEGCSLSLCDKLETISNVAEEIKNEFNVQTLSFILDISKLEEVENMVSKTIDKFGKIDILINNAGITKDNLILRMSENDWDSVIDVNLKGCFNFIKCVSKYMIKQRSGKIVNISSVIGMIGNAGQINYAASKAGIIGLTKSAAKELASRNITVNAIAPGFIKTPMTDKLSEDVKNKILANIPLNKFGEPKDVANAVLFLVSDNANYITGEIIRVDGGLAM
jgi:3-oxoacyl-[acyl-carrier protein] reductase